MTARRLFQPSHSRRRSLAAVVVRAYVSLSYKIEYDDHSAPSQLMTRLVVPLPGLLAGLLYFLFSSLLDPIQAAVSAVWSGLTTRLRDRYIRFLVWLGAEPPPGYEYLLNRDLLNRELALEVIYV